MTLHVFVWVCLQVLDSLRSFKDAPRVRALILDVMAKDVPEDELDVVRRSFESCDVNRDGMIG